MLNRLVYDSNYIDFIKEMSTFDDSKGIITVLDSLKHYRPVNDVFFEKLETHLEAIKESREGPNIETIQDENREEENKEPMRTREY